MAFARASDAVQATGSAQADASLRLPSPTLHKNTTEARYGDRDNRRSRTRRSPENADRSRSAWSTRDYAASKCRTRTGLVVRTVVDMRFGIDEALGVVA